MKVGSYLRVQLLGHCYLGVHLLRDHVEITAIHCEGRVECGGWGVVVVVVVVVVAAVLVTVAAVRNLPSMRWVWISWPGEKPGVRTWSQHTGNGVQLFKVTVYSKGLPRSLMLLLLLVLMLLME